MRGDASVGIPVARAAGRWDGPTCGQAPDAPSAQRRSRLKRVGPYGNRWFLPFVLAVCVPVAVAYALTQGRMAFRRGLVWDANSYVTMAEQFHQGVPLSAAAPFTYRVALPWLVGEISWKRPMLGFCLFNVAAGLLTLPILVQLWQRHLRHRVVVGMLALLFVASPHSPFRIGVLYPGLVDAPAFLFVCLILLLGTRPQAARPRLTLLLASLTILGVLFREVVLVASFAVMAAQVLESGEGGGALRRRPWREIVLAAVPTILGVLVLVMLHATIVPNPPSSLVKQAIRTLTYHLRSPSTLPLSFLAAFGPMVALLLFFFRPLARFLIAQRVYLAYWLGFLALACVGGSDTDRFFFWGFPVVYLLLGLAVEELWASRGWLGMLCLFSPLVLAQVPATRAFWQLPNADHDVLLNPDADPRPELFLLSPYGPSSNSAQVFSAFMGDRLRRVLLHQYLAVLVFAVMAFFVLSIVVPGKPGCVGPEEDACRARGP